MLCSCQQLTLDVPFFFFYGWLQNMYSNKVRVVETYVFYSGDCPSWQTGRPHKKYCFLTKGIFQKVTQVQHLSVPEELGFLMWKWRRRICQCAKSLLTYILTTQNQSRLPAWYPCHSCMILVFTQSSKKIKTHNQSFHWPDSVKQTNMELSEKNQKILAQLSNKT